MVLLSTIKPSRRKESKVGMYDDPSRLRPRHHCVVEFDGTTLVWVWHEIRERHHAPGLVNLVQSAYSCADIRPGRISRGIGQNYLDCSIVVGDRGADDRRIERGIRYHAREKSSV